MSIIHIKSDPYDLSSPAACGEKASGERLISPRVAATIVERSVSKLAQIRVEELCTSCVEQMESVLREIQCYRREEAREIAELEADWPGMPNLADGVDRFGQYPVAGEREL